MQPRPPATIEVRLATAAQLFNSMDPSPFHERDLDHDAEAFIVGWARELPAEADIRLLVTLRSCDDLTVGERIRDSVRNYFAAREASVRRDLRLLLAEGRTALGIGLAFLGLTLTLARLVPAEAAWGGIVREGLTICGWVGMWRPLEIHLYRWWPLLREARLHRRISRSEVVVRVAP